MNSYSFDAPAIITLDIKAESESEARAKAGIFDHIEYDVPLKDAATSSNSHEFGSKDSITCISGYGTPELVGEDTVIDLEMALRVAAYVRSSLSDFNELISDWESASGDNGSNDAEHACGYSMAEQLKKIRDLFK